MKAIKSIDTQLSILLRLDSFAFMARTNSEVTQFEQIPWKAKPGDIQHLPLQELIALVDQHDLAKVAQKHVQVNVDHSQFTLVPKKLFDRSRWWVYLQSIFPALTRDDICFMQTDDLVVVYAYPLALRRVLSTLLPHSIVRPFVTSILGYLSGSASKTLPALYSVHSGGQLYLLTFLDGKIKLLNRYPATSAADVIYYILLVSDQMDLDLLKTTLKMAASKSVAKEVQSVLGANFRDFQMIDWLNGWRLPLHVNNPAEVFELYCMQHAHHSR